MGVAEKPGCFIVCDGCAHTLSVQGGSSLSCTVYVSLMPVAGAGRAISCAGGQGGSTNECMRACSWLAVFAFFATTGRVGLCLGGAQALVHTVGTDGFFVACLGGHGPPMSGDAWALRGLEAFKRRVKTSIDGYSGCCLHAHTCKACMYGMRWRPPVCTCGFVACFAWACGRFRANRDSLCGFGCSGVPS